MLAIPGARGFVPYAYDPELDKEGMGPDDDDDLLHRADYGDGAGARWSWRGLMNIAMLLIVILALLTLFICYPVVNFFNTNQRNQAIDGNVRVNGTGQVSVL